MSESQAYTPEKFWAQVDKAGECWVWTGALNDKGYGQPRYHGKHRKAHRVAWELTNGPIPEGMWLLHRCDNPPCVRPDHLYVGTHQDNMRDVASAGTRKGSRHHNSKLTEDDIQVIRYRLAAGESSRAIGRAFGVNQSTIVRAANGKAWTHV